MNDHDKSQDAAQQSEYARELADLLSLLEAVDREITPEHVARRFRELLGETGDGTPPMPSADERLRRALNLSDHDGHFIAPRRKYEAERCLDPMDLMGSMEAAIAAARGAAADIIADAQLKAEAAADDLRRAREEVVAARQQAQEALKTGRQEAEQIIATARDEALNQAAQMIHEAKEQAGRILSDARTAAEQAAQMIYEVNEQAGRILSDARTAAEQAAQTVEKAQGRAEQILSTAHREAEQITTAGRSQQVHQTAWDARGYTAVQCRMGSAAIKLSGETHLAKTDAFQRFADYIGITVTADRYLTDPVRDALLGSAQGEGLITLVDACGSSNAVSIPVVYEADREWIEWIGRNLNTYRCSGRFAAVGFPTEPPAGRHRRVVMAVAVTVTVGRAATRDIIAGAAGTVFLTDAGSNGLLVERESGQYCFAHHTFQEYLAAVHVPGSELLAGHHGRVVAVEVSRADGRDIIVPDTWDGTVRVWDLASSHGDLTAQRDRVIRAHNETAITQLTGLPTRHSGIPRNASPRAAEVDTEEIGYRGPVACAAARVTDSQLDYWARTGLVKPSVHGSGSQRLYSFRNIVVLKVVKRLLDTGISLQQIRAAVQHLRDRGSADLAQVTLMSDGVSVYECTSADEVVDLLQGGQGVFGIALGRVWREVAGDLAGLPAEQAKNGLSEATGDVVIAMDTDQTDQLELYQAQMRAVQAERDMAVLPAAQAMGDYFGRVISGAGWSMPSGYHYQR